MQSSQCSRHLWSALECCTSLGVADSVETPGVRRYYCRIKMHGFGDKGLLQTERPQKIIQISCDGNISPDVRVAGACSSEAVREKGEEKVMGKTSRQVNSYHRSFKIS